DVAQWKTVGERSPSTRVRLPAAHHEEDRFLMDTTRGATRLPGRLGNRIARVSIVGCLALGALTGCATASGTSGFPTGGDRVVLLVSATTHEPRPMLTEHARATLRTAANSENVTDGPSGKGSVAVVTTADGRFSEPLPLTPRRANGAVEHGLQRDTLIENNLRDVSDTMLATRAQRPGLDLLQGIDDAIAGADGGVLILVSNGLSTDGGLDLRQVGWNADPGQLVARLRERDLLPDLTGWRVLVTGLGGTAGDQAPLPQPTRQKLTAYWKAICAATAEFCEFDDTRFERTTPVPGPEMPVVPIPDISSVTGPDGAVTTTLSDRVLGFAGDSAALSPAALGLLADTAARINTRLSGQPDTSVTVRGYTADPPGSTQVGRLQLSQERARAVAAALTAAGVTNKIVTIGGAAAPGPSAMVGGAFDEARATAMRRVEITY
ncbi:MAG: OmpA family protein, partial [Pseudonocardiaceae bacterium]